MAYITYAEWDEFFDSDYPQSTVEKVIDWASEIVDSETGTRFESTSATETQFGDGVTFTFYLEKTPIISIESAKYLDDSGNETDVTVNYYLSDIGRVVLDTAIPRNYRVVFSYTYGDTDNLNLAKLATIYLTQVGLQMMKLNGGVMPSERIRLGDIEYTVARNEDTKRILMDANDILQRLKRNKLIIVNRSDRYDYYRRF